MAVAMAMETTRVLTAGNVVAVNGRLWWRCATCGRTLGELIAGRIVIKAGDRLVIAPAGAAIEQRCPMCGGMSVLLSRSKEPDSTTG